MPRDLRRFIYAAIDVIAATAYLACALWVIPNRLPDAQLHMLLLPVCAGAMGVGCLIGGRVGWWIAAGAATGLLLTAVGLLVRILVSAAYLAGVFGSLGKAASVLALVGAALLIEVVGLLPVFQLRYLMSRSGRRSFGQPAINWNRL